MLDENFLEQDSGEYAGMLLTDVGEKLGTQDISKIRHAYRWNSVEPWDIFSQKVSSALDRVIAENTGKKILIGAHAGVFRACTQYFYNLEHEDVFYGEGIKNACLYRFPKTPKTHELDTWILSQLHNLIADTRKHMDNYDTQKACDGFVVFLDGLNNWYIRRNRRRFWRKEVDADKCSAYETLHEVLTTVCQLLAPICPFMTETLYGYLKGAEEGSVHLTYFPEAHPLIRNLTVNQKMRDLQNLTNLGLAIRGREKLRVRQPLRSASITIDLDESARATLAEELNVKEIHTITDIAEYVTITYSPDAKQIGTSERRQWMKNIIADAKAGKGVLLEDGSLQIGCSEAPEGKIILVAEEFETIYTPKEGSTIAFAGNAGYVIGLDTTLDEALTFEGYARDLIRAVQEVRKELGFQVTDRLQLSLTSESPILTGILSAHQSLIESETLCTVVGVQSEKESKVIELDEDISVTIVLSR